ncbi:MAG TPA: GWxTD domain-containing protein, partial [Thermoanaerobaculia bacterium]|nr:GWxTD domain-containing protein [Thermoanaerobaculia bacterium]
MLVGLATISPSEAASKKAEQKAERKQIEQAIAALPEKYRSWLEEVEVLISDDEVKAFLALSQDYQRDAFIERFWQSRDPYPDTARNEMKERFKATLERVHSLYPDLHEERARIMLLNGEPADLITVRCPTVMWPTEIWYYHGSNRVHYDFFLVFYQPWGAGRARLWQPLDGMDVLFEDGGGARAVQTDPTVRLAQIRNSCYRGDDVAAMFGAILSQSSFDYLETLNLATTKPDTPTGEWVSTFSSYSTDLPAGAVELPASWETSFPGKRQSRTTVQGLITVARADAGVSDLAGYRSYNFVLTGEILAEDKLFERFRYKYDFPLEEVTGDKVAFAFLRLLRPGDYRVVIKVEDLNNKKIFRSERAVTVPVFDGAPPPLDPQTALLLAEATAAVARGDVTLKIIEPPGELLSGLRRIDTLTTGEGIDHVTFTLDSKPILTKKRPPFSVELDLGSLPRPRTLEANAYDAAGELLTSDRVVLNASSHRFSVHLIEPHRGGIYKGSLRAAVDVQVPEGAELERVELFLNETRLATLYQPPWEQSILLPPGGAVSYVQAVAYLTDGASTQDLVFINA